MKKIYFYPGRFQPMGPHHAEVFSKIMSDYDTENIGPFIVTSNKVELPKSPLSFEEKKQVMIAHGIPGDRILQVKNPYYAREILFEYDPSEVEAIYLVGAKDMAENPRFQKTEGITKEGYKWSIEVAPHIEKDVEGEEMSGTTLRKTLANADEETFYSIMGFQNKKIYDLLTQKFSQIEEDFYDPRNKYYDFAKSSEWKAGMPDGSKPDIPRKGDQIHKRQKTRGVVYETRGGEPEIHIYDFDETIARVETPIPYSILSPDGTEIEGGETTSVEFEEKQKEIENDYDEGVTVEFDFKAFERQIGDAIINEPVYEKLKNSLSNPNVKTTVLTARSIGHPVTKYLKDIGLEVYVVPLGLQIDGKVTGQDKADWINSRIKKTTKRVYFIDDSENNRIAVNLLKDKHPDITFDIEDPPKIEEMLGTMTKQEKAKHKKNLTKLRKYTSKQGDQYVPVPDFIKGTLTRKLYKEQYTPKLHMDDDPYNHEDIGHYTTNTALINDITIPLETMRTPEEQTTGMMDREELKGGMIFPYDEVSKKDFHMEGCLIPLDIVFINKGTIDTIHNNCPPCKELPCPKYSGLADNVLELPGGYCKENNINVGDKFNLNLTENKMKESIFTKKWWKGIINEFLLKEGGAAGHMAHPFNLPDVNSGQDLLNIFKKSADSLQNTPGSVKIDGVNASVRLVDIDGEKQFALDRGSKQALDLKGVTKADLEDRFKTKDGTPHGFIKTGGEVLDMFNEALPDLENDLKALGAWDDPNILFNMEYVSGQTNVQKYDNNFIAIHGLNRIEMVEEPSEKTGRLLLKRISKEISYNKNDLQSLLNNLTPTANKRGFEVYGSVPTEMVKKPNFSSALSQNYTIISNEGEKTQTLEAWLNELNNIPEEDFIFMDGVKRGAVSKLIYTTLLDGGNIDELFENEEDKQKAIEGWTTYLATEKLGDEILKVLDSPMGSADNHEGVVIRDENIASVPFKITGKFILGGLQTGFR